MSAIGRAIGGYKFLEQLAERRVTLDVAIAILEAPSGEHDIAVARGMNLYLPEYDAMRADLAKILRAFRTAGRGR